MTITTTVPAPSPNAAPMFQSQPPLTSVQQLAALISGPQPQSSSMPQVSPFSLAALMALANKAPGTNVPPLPPEGQGLGAGPGPGTGGLY